MGGWRKEESLSNYTVLYGERITARLVSSSTWPDLTKQDNIMCVLKLLNPNQSIRRFVIPTVILLSPYGECFLQKSQVIFQILNWK